MKSGYLTASTPKQLARSVADLHAATAIIDIEPLIAHWDTDQETLHRGLVSILGALGGTGLRTIVFATNSARTPTAQFAATDLDITYRPPPPPGRSSCASSDARSSHSCFAENEPTDPEATRGLLKQLVELARMACDRGCGLYRRTRAQPRSVGCVPLQSAMVHPWSMVDRDAEWFAIYSGEDDIRARDAVAA